MKSRTYRTYKTCGHPHLGELPTHWMVRGLGRAFSIVGSGTTPKSGDPTFYDDGTVPWVNTGDLSDTVLLECERRVTERAVREHSSLRRYPAGAVVIAMYGATIGKLAILSFEATVNQACCVFAGSSEVLPRFAFFTLMGLRPRIVALAYGGGQPNISQETLRALRIPVPPIEEQTAIAAFLDRETGKIDALVEEQRRLIELLKEKRQAVISHAVTKGLDPNVRMKPSGVEWLGDVPEHWEVRPIKSLATLAGRIGYRGYTTADIVAEGEGAVTLSPSNIREGVVSFDQSTYISWEKYEESPEIQLAAHDVVMVKTGSTLGKVGFIADGSIPLATINPQLVIFKEIRCLPEYLFLVLNAAHIRGRIKVSNTGGSIPTMTQEAIGNFKVALPSSAEQREITNHATIECSRIDRLAAHASKAIALLQERRSALISEAVTGKIDVRHSVADEEVAA